MVIRLHSRSWYTWNYLDDDPNGGKGTESISWAQARDVVGGLEVPFVAAAVPGGFR